MLKLEDLVPAEQSFELSEKPGKIYVLRKFSLREQIWIRERFKTPEKVNEVFRTSDLVAISEIAHHLLKDKTDFPTFIDFAACIVTHKDKVDVMKAMLGTIGISQPIFSELEQAEIAKRESETPKE